ncbi:beta-lactamase superfamily II metal-dependent hydrolase [Pseudoduganella lurida]|uniref:Beta-lactamase superfamily II metal-dependent hydrolase n=1 Tax=Pseudoduganella lurida TaxID=1036180 RepID=A0A562RM04_9BURK|nr:MBL fold metallo-hydrolase [Pseudoduganella lurida]TWI69486.1 beta-lactamase superfamily II metal-dependent hydrolase [Pseudoduganella lurida]
MAAPNEARRRLLRALLAMTSAPLPVLAGEAAVDVPGQPMRAWQAGWLDIHHLATGRGNATFIQLPDGTSLLIDAGASVNGTDVSVATRPDGSRAGEWIGRYVQRHLRRAGLTGLDYLLATHLHPDHTGDVDAASPWSTRGAYRLSGVTDVADLVPVRMLVDRGYPAYAYPARFDAPFAGNYRAFVDARRRAGLGVERFRVGSATQIGARGHRQTALPFEVRNIAANGEVWTGQGEGARSLFPPLASLLKPDWPSENQCSAALRIGYGGFSYFTGGDLTSYTNDGALPWQDVLGPAAHAAGAVTVATADHHGMFDGLNGDVVRTLRPRVWVIPSWHIAHPDMLQLERIFSERLYTGPRDVYATSVMKENLLANGRLTKRLRSHEGHVVVRVLPGGARFYVAVTENSDEGDRVAQVGGMLVA